MGTQSIIHWEPEPQVQDGFVYWNQLLNATRLCRATPQLCHAAPERDLGTNQGLWSVGMNVWHPIPGTPWSWQHRDCWKHWDMEMRLCSCDACGWPFLSERITQGWRREAGRIFTEKEREERPSASNLLHILPFWPLHCLPKELCKILSNPYSSASKKQLHRQKHGQQAVGAKNKKKYISTSYQQQNLCLGSTLFIPCLRWVRSLCCCSSLVQHWKASHCFHSPLHRHIQCCSSSQGNHPIPSRGCCRNIWLRKHQLSTMERSNPWSPVAFHQLAPSWTAHSSARWGARHWTFSSQALALILHLET